MNRGPDEHLLSIYRVLRLIEIAQFLAWKLLDIHVFETQNAHLRDEAALAVHVPHPRVGQLHFNQRPSAVSLYGHINIVGQVKPSLSLHSEAEHGRHILVFMREMKFAICFVIFQIVSTQ